MRKDIYKHKEPWETWKEKVKETGQIPGIDKANSEIILAYVGDMEKGLNISSKSRKGSRAPNRLNTIKDRMIFLSKKFESLYGIKKLVNITEEQLFTFFSDMQHGIIKTDKGTVYK